jgi:ABC-type glycerol-3-phosphate transport system substrate-binding protein
MSPRLRAFDEQVVARWNELHPGEVVELEAVDHDVLRDEVETRLTAEVPPDVLTWFAGNRRHSFAERGLLMDLAPLWDAEGFTSAYEPIFRRIAESDVGRIDFLPTSYYWWAIYYRPSLFAELGIGTPIRTWDDLLAASDLLQSAGRTPIALGARHRCPAAAWFDYLNMRVNGPAFHAALMALEVPYTDDGVRAAFARLGTLLERGFFTERAAGVTEEAAVASVLRGDASMILAGAYILDEYVPAGEDDLAFFRFPVVDASVPVGEDAPVDGFCIAGKTRHPEAARAFLGLLGSRGAQQLAVESVNALPTRNDVDCRAAAPMVRQGLELLRAADRLVQFYDLDTPWPMADAGMRAFVRYLEEPSALDEILHELEALRVHLVEEPELSRRR